MKLLSSILLVMFLTACSTTTQTNNHVVTNQKPLPPSQAYYFVRDKTDLQQQNYTALNTQANYLIAHPNVTVLLIGNADECGSPEYNIILGWNRAKTIANLLEQQGVLPKQINMVSYGAEKPIALGHNEAAWRKNRRVNLIYEVQ